MRWLVTLLFVSSLTAQPAPDFSAVEQSAREELAKLNIPGASIAIVRGDRVVFAKGVGIADVETGEAVRPDMVFRLGSTTKMFTATALVGLAVEGKIDLNAPIGKYIPNLPPKLSQITANQLLSHTAGIHDEAPMYGSHDESALGNGIHAWTDDWLFASPGKIFSYSNPGYWLAGYLVETLSGMPYADAEDVRIFRPLGMQHSSFRPLMAMTWPLAQGHDAGPDGKPRVARPAADNAASWPAGSLFSTTHDLARFVIAFLNDGRIDGKQVIDPKVIAALSTPHVRYPDSEESYGYGLTIHEFRGVHVIEHGGSRMGYGSHIRMLPAQRSAIIIQTNRSGANLPATVDKATEMLASLQPKEETRPKPPLAVTESDLTRVAGTYRNGDQHIEIFARDGRLFLKRGGREVALVKHSESRYAPENGPDIVVVAGRDGKAEYLFNGSRALARLQ